MRKVMWRLLPLMALMFLVNQLDRVNVSFAALTMNRDIGVDAAGYALGAGIFFLSYFAFEIPSNLILERVGARIWIARIMITWGILAGVTALVTGAVSFGVVRIAGALRVTDAFRAFTFFTAVFFFAAAFFAAN